MVELDLDRRPVRTPDLDLVQAVAVAVLLFDLEHGPATGRLQCRGLRVLRGGARDRILGASADRLGDAAPTPAMARAPIAAPITTVRRFNVMLPLLSLAPFE